MPRVPGCEAVYDVANQWRNRCLVGDGSLLWPAIDEETWTHDALDQARIVMNDLVELRTMRDVDMIERFKQEIPATKRVIADATAIWSICPGFPTPKNRKSVLAGVAKAATPSPRLDEINEAIDCEIGKPELAWNKAMYQAGRGWELLYLIRLCQAVKERGIDFCSFIEFEKVATEVVQRTTSGATGRLMMMHLLFPDQFEPIFSIRDRREILSCSAFAEYIKPDATESEALESIRSALVRQGHPVGFSFYDSDVHAIWSTRHPKQEEQSAKGIAYGDSVASPVSSLSDLAFVSFIDLETLGEIESLLLSKQQIIFEGPPGSGKTYVARLFARYLAGVGLDDDSTDRVEIVQFHQSYGYEDFVAGIRPVTSESGQLTYRSQPGIFLEMCQRAMERPDEQFVLIIDEINRGNLSRIFGELLYGLEYRDQPVRLQTPIELGGETIEHLRIPSNLYLIGTMNSTDRSLAMIDYALRRRFYFWRLMPTEGGSASVLGRWLAAQPEISPAARTQLHDAFVDLNERIAGSLGPDYQIGHSYFMLGNGEIGDPAAHARVWRHAIEPLLREYFHTRSDAETTIEQFRVAFFQEPLPLVESIDEFEPDA